MTLWDAERKELILRMPTNTHDIFVDSLTQEIWDQSRALRASDENLGNIMGSLERRMAELKLPDTSVKIPDDAFGCDTVKYPRFIVEVADTQIAKDLESLACRYIQSSRNSISHR